MKNILTVLLLAIALSAAAQQEPPAAPPQWQSKAWMCSGPYALCIKALCNETPDADGNVTCQCSMQNGWNMGPNSCDDRKANLTSTYSNAFNGGRSLVSCPAKTQWAWCYGAKCTRNPNPLIAVCKCPVENIKPALVLVDSDQCSDPDKICARTYSAATPAESTFANDYYYWWITAHGLETDPPSQPCSPATTSAN
jgi:hypothetical protein